VSSVEEKRGDRVGLSRSPRRGREVKGLIGIAGIQILWAGTHGPDSLSDLIPPSKGCARWKRGLNGGAPLENVAFLAPKDPRRRARNDEKGSSDSTIRSIKEIPVGRWGLRHRPLSASAFRPQIGV